MTELRPGPNTFLSGTAKAGTTSLARYLAQHPQVFLPATKEPNYYLFSGGRPSASGPVPEATVDFLLHRFSVSDEGVFRRMYAPGSSSPVRLDASVRYLYHPEALERICDERPDARHIVVLRDPVERIVSHWRMNRQQQLEPLALLAALAAEDERVEAGWGWDWHYRRVSAYSRQFEQLLQRFPRSAVHVVLYGDLVSDPDAVIRSCFEFLGVDPEAEVDRSEQGMVPVEPRFLGLDRLVNWPTTTRRLIRTLPAQAGDRVLDRVVRWNSRPPTPVSFDSLDALYQQFEQDRVVMAALLGMDADEYGQRISGRAASARRSAGEAGLAA